MSEDEAAIAMMLKGSVTLYMNKKEGYMTLTTIGSESLLTAQLAKKSQELLQVKITAYKTQRAMDQLAFFEKRYQEKKVEYLRAQNKLASYRDRNLFVTSAIESNEGTRLQDEYNLAFSVYSELAKQLENAKIKVKRVTPVYVIIKPIVVPIEPFAPRKSVILFVSILLGGIIGLGLIFTRHYFAFSKVKARKNIND
jgi:LPS O-antigen subunit length determinant protein (WzzB/FepE family)